MPKFDKSYHGGTLRSLLFQYANDRSKVDAPFKAEFDATQSELRRQRVAAATARQAREAAKAAAQSATAAA